MQLSAMTASIKVSGSVNCGYVGYDPIVLLKPVGEIINATTKTYTDFATDGSHIWVRANGKSTVKYNNQTCEFAIHGNNFMITLPNNYDPTIPFVF